MWSTGRPIWIPILTFSLMSLSSSALSADQPPARKNGNPTRLSGYALGIAIDRSTLGMLPGEPLTITSETVRHFATDGRLTVGRLHNRPRPLAAAPLTIGEPSNPQRAEQEWRAKVLRQKDQVAKIEGAILLLDTQIEVIKASVAHGRDGAARRQAKVVEARGRRAVLIRQLERERARLGSLIRRAREQGAQPGWFR